MASIKTSSRAPVPEPRSGEDLVLQPLDPEEVLEKRRSRARRARAIAAVATSLAVAVFSMFAAYRYLGSVVSATSRGVTAALPKSDAKLGEIVPQALEVPFERVLPLPQPPKVSGGPGSVDRNSPQTRSEPPVLDSEPAGIGEPAPGRTADPRKSPNSLAERPKGDTLRNHSDPTKPEIPKRHVPKSTPPPAKPTEPEATIRPQGTKETIARMKVLISKGNFASAANMAGAFRDRGITATTKESNEYRELLKLQRTAIEQHFKSSPNIGRSPTQEVDLAIAVSEHDLMDAYALADMSTFAREHFLNAEQAYERAIVAARQLERTNPMLAKREMQLIKDHLGQLYLRWAEYKLDNAILRDAEVVIWESEQLLDFAENQSAARRELDRAKERIEQTRRRLP